MGFVARNATVPHFTVPRVASEIASPGVDLKQAQCAAVIRHGTGGATGAAVRRIVIRDATAGTGMVAAMAIEAALGTVAGGCGVVHKWASRAGSPAVRHVVIA